jgi:serine/threonine protein kinase
MDRGAKPCDRGRVTLPEERQFGRYRVVATLGKGGMGEVYAAVDEVLGREVAIKTLRGANGELGAALLDARFKHEARAIAQLAHPGVVQVFDLDTAASPPYLVMERVMGPSLSVRLETGPLGLDEVRALGVQIARALAAAHDQGIIHRDVKPGNILVAGGGRWKLADFGVAHVPDSSLTMTGQFVGSPAYAAPEALTRGELGAPADVYGLGAVLYEAASGTWPRADASSPGIAALLAPPPPLRGLAPHVPPELASVIERALAPDPSARPNADELARAIAEHRSMAPAPLLATTTIAVPDSLPVAVSATTTAVPLASVAPGVGVVPTRPRTWRNRAIWIAAALGLALVIGIAIGSRKRDGDDTSAATVTSPSEDGLGDFGGGSHDDSTITATPPDGLRGRSAKDWNQIVDSLYAGDFEGARARLAEFERRYGRSQETADLAKQLEQLGAHELLPPDDRGRGKKFKGWDD